MPFYEYECADCKFYVEALQKISDKPLKQCPSCKKQTLKKLVSAPVFRLKGGGWYETDFKSDKEEKRNIAGREEPAESKAEESKAEGKEAGKEAKAEPAAAESKTAKAPSKPPVASGKSKPKAKAPARPAKARPKAKPKAAKKKGRR
jgi:putative FmdB family regulatory protein